MSFAASILGATGAAAREVGDVTVAGSHVHEFVTVREDPEFLYQECSCGASQLLSKQRSDSGR